jgi:hypothetical protein
MGIASTIRENQLIAQIKIPEGATPGIHFVSELAIIDASVEGVGERLNLRFASPIFEVRHHLELEGPSSNLDLRLADLERQRNNYIGRIHITRSAAETDGNVRDFRTIVFATGCNIHIEQQMDGYRITPLQTGLSHRHLLSVVNQYLDSENVEAIPFLDETEAQFANSTPTMAIDTGHIKAINHLDALDYSNSLASDIFQILGFEQGQIPRKFAAIAIEYGTSKRWHSFEIPWYRGNQLRGFEPSQIARTIDTYLPLLRDRPFQRLLLRSFAEATDEDDRGFQILRYWTVLELAADRTIRNDIEIRHPNGDPVLLRDGSPRTTKHKGNRVYEYIRRMDGFRSQEHRNVDGVSSTIEVGYVDSSSESEQEYKYSLFDIVDACYAIRNSVAHEGFYDPAAESGFVRPIASRFATQGFPDLLSFLKMQAKLTIWRER